MLYIEDAYLIDDFKTQQNKIELMKHAIQRSIRESCCRVEMRVLKTFNIGYDVIGDLGFSQIKKWDVYRIENPHLHPQLYRDQDIGE